MHLDNYIYKGFDGCGGYRLNHFCRGRSLSRFEAAVELEGRISNREAGEPITGITLPFSSVQ